MADEWRAFALPTALQGHAASTEHFTTHEFRERGGPTIELCRTGPVARNTPTLPAGLAQVPQSDRALRGVECTTRMGKRASFRGDPQAGADVI